MFAFPVHDELNDAVRRLPGRWFDWQRKHWRVPADPLLAKDVAELLARFPELTPDPTVLAWMSDSDRWRALVSVTARDGHGVFVVRTLSGDAPDDLPGETPESFPDRRVVPFTPQDAAALRELDGLDLDDLARACLRELLRGRSPAPAELSLELDFDGEPQLELRTIWNPAPAKAYRQLSEAHQVDRHGRIFNRSAAWGVAVPADPALAHQISDFVAEHPDLGVEPAAREALEELITEHDRAAATVALSYAKDAELELELGGELHPFQRAGVRYALERRRTFIADEQGLGKTVQALATIEADGAFPTVVVCPASMKLTWERESRKWLPRRTVAVLEGRTDTSWTQRAQDADVLVLNYDILEAHAARLARHGMRALILDESHYVKNPRAQRTKTAFELASGLPDDALRLALTGTPVLNRADELIAQLRVLGRLGEFGSGARLSRRFRDAASDDRLHWNLRAHCYVRRTKKEVLPQLPAKRSDTVPVLLSNEHDYRAAERDVIAWLQSLPLDLRTIDAKVAAALRAEQLVRLNHLRQLAANGKLPPPSPGSPTSSPPGSRSWCSRSTSPSSARSWSGSRRPATSSGRTRASSARRPWTRSSARTARR